MNVFVVTGFLIGRSLFIGVICKAIVWLYLKDKESSKLVLVPAAVSILIDLWKLSKAVSVRVCLEGIKMCALV